MKQIAKDFGIHQMMLQKWMSRADPALCVNVSACDSTEGAEVGGFILDDLEVVSREHIIKG